MVDLTVSLKVPAVEKLVDYTASGVGSVAGAILGPWIAGRRIKASLIEAKGQAEVLGIQAAAHSSSYQLIAEAQTSAREQVDQFDSTIQSQVTLSDQIEQSITFQAGKRVANVSGIVRGAADRLGDREAPDVEPDLDWTARFFGDAQDVSSEDMQALYSKVLAGEVERPGSTSMHTLSILRDLSRDTAKLFARLCSLSLFYTISETTIHDGRVVSLGGNAGTNALSDYKLPYGALTRLEEHGLITSEYHSWLDYGSFPSRLQAISRGSPAISKSRIIQALGDDQAIKYAGDTWYLQCVEDGSPIGEIKIDGVAMSHAGRELSKVVTLTPDTEYTAALATFLMGKGLELRRIHDHALLGHDE